MVFSPSPTKPRRLAPGVFMVAGPDLTDPRDCLCYLVVGSEARVLIDAGSGPSAQRILDLTSQVCNQNLTHLLVTHSHIDHAGGVAEIQRLTGCQVLIHGEDAHVLANGDEVRSAAHWYGLTLEPFADAQPLTDNQELPLDPDRSLHVLHTPGHTPGSICAWCMAGEDKVLFGQDVHGPFSPAFGSDLQLWRQSMQRLLDLKADILAEGHYGVYRPAEDVERFITNQLALQG
jgi:glyoxylase-like metal-dependent hydrolase (beta-lactamase superfamily II)